MEIGPEVCEKCLVDESTAIRFEGKRSLFVQVIALLTQGKVEREGALLDRADFAALLLVNKELYAFLSTKTFWLRFLGFILPTAPPGLSPLKLFGELVARSKDDNWKRNLLTTNVVEGLDKPGVLHKIRCSVTGALSKQFWMDQFKGLVCLPNYPTGPQAAELKASMGILKKRGGTTADMVAVMTDNSPNKVMCLVAVHHLCTTPGFKGTLSWVDVVGLLDSATSLFHLYALFHDVSVDLLKASKYVFKKKVKLPGTIQKAMVHAIAGMSWLALSGFFTEKGLSRQLFRSLHLNAALNAALKKATQKAGTEANQKKAKNNNNGEKKASWGADDVEGIEQAVLMLYCLRDNVYPAEKDWDHWKTTVVKPLRKLVNSNPLFGHEEEWMAEEWNKDLEGKELRKPRNRSLQAVLAQDGNTRNSWDFIIKRGILSLPQILMNLRSLIFLGYDLAKFDKILAKADADLLKVVKLRQFLLSVFNNDLIKYVEAALKKSATDNKFKKVVQEDGSTLVQVEMLPQIFRDKKGQATELSVKRFVHKDFCRKDVDKATAWLDGIISRKVEQLKIQGREGRQGVILYTEELNNVLRTGMPPSIPTYSKCSLWRNEMVCLQEFETEGDKFDKIRTGISWCQGPGAPRIDLDLSTSLYDKDWKFLDHCSFSQLRLKEDCCVHSGDITSAPYPKGAREALEINVPLLRKLYPECVYIIMQVYSYSGVKFDDMYDASVFVANSKKRGTGPEGMDVICAARLAGEGKTNISAFVKFGQDNLTYLCCVDQSLNVNNRAATDSKEIIASMGRIITEGRLAEVPIGVPTWKQAALMGACACDSLVVRHKEGYEVVEREGRDDMAYWDAICDVFSKLSPVVSHSIDASEDAFKKDGELFLMVGDNVDREKLALSLTPFHPEEKEEEEKEEEEEVRITIVNLRAPVVSAEIKHIQFAGKVLFLNGIGIKETFELYEKNTKK